jgi:hypothetical protein
MFVNRTPYTSTVNREACFDIRPGYGYFVCMKKVSIAVAESTWETVQKLARVQNIEPDRLLAQLLDNVKGASPSLPPSGPQRRATLEKIWADIDACNVEVGECPSRARTYDHRRFHRH